MAGSAFWTAGGWPISMIVVWRKLRAITSPRTPPIVIRSPTLKVWPRKITKYPASAVTTFWSAKASPAVTRPSAVVRPGRVVEPDRDQAEEEDDRGRQPDALAGPELGPLVPPAAERDPGEELEEPAQQEDEGEEADREQELPPVLRVDADELDPEHLDGVVRADEADDLIHGRWASRFGGSGRSWRELTRVRRHGAGRGRSRR